MKSNTCHITFISQGAIRTQVPNSNRRNKICLHLTTESVTPSAAPTVELSVRAETRGPQSEQDGKLSPSNRFAFTTQYRCTDHGTIGKRGHAYSLSSRVGQSGALSQRVPPFVATTVIMLCYFRICHPSTSSN